MNNILFTIRTLFRPILLHVHQIMSEGIFTSPLLVMSEISMKPPPEESNSSIRTASRSLSVKAYAQNNLEDDLTNLGRSDGSRIWLNKSFPTPTKHPDDSGCRLS